MDPRTQTILDALRVEIREAAGDGLALLTGEAAPAQSAHERLRAHALLTRIRDDAPIDAPTSAHLRDLLAKLRREARTGPGDPSFWPLWVSLTRLERLLQEALARPRIRFRTDLLQAFPTDLPRGTGSPSRRGAPISATPFAAARMGRPKKRPRRNIRRGRAARSGHQVRRPSSSSRSWRLTREGVGEWT